MTDMVKEIFAGTLTVADIASTGSATLATTNANTQYVIKDVSVSGTFSPSDTPSLSINDFAVAKLNKSVTGSEIVDINSTVKYQAYETAPSLTSRSFKLISGSSGALDFQDFTNNEINGVVQNTSINDPVRLLSNPDTWPQVSEFAQATDGSLFYVHWDGNSAQRLYKRTGGVNGTETLISNQSYGWFVFNGVDTYYEGRSNSATLFKTNINTGVITTSSFPFVLSTSSYPSASLMNNGNLVVNPTGDGQTNNLNIIDPVANTSTNVSGLTNLSFSGNNYKISGYYNAATNRYTLYRRSGTTLYKTQLNGALTVGSSYSGGVTNTQYNLGSGFGNVSGNFNHTYVEVDNVNYTVALHGVGNKTDLITFNTLTSEKSTRPWIPLRTDTNTIIQDTTTSASPSVFANTVKVRVTGVKTTL